MEDLPDLGSVVDKILEQLPEGEYQDLRDALAAIMDSLRYSAPEMLSHWWLQVAHGLNIYLPNSESEGFVMEGWLENIQILMKGEELK